MNIEFYKEQLLAKEDMLARTTKYLLEVQDNLIQRNDVISGINKSLFESISFAGIIQTSLLPDVEILKKHTSDAAFEVNNQIGIGGDSVIIKESDGTVSFGLMDATGHGIPAAMLSISAMMILNELFASLDSTQPEILLKELNARLFATFNKMRSIAHLEGILCVYSPGKRMLKYSIAKGKGIRISADGTIRSLPSAGKCIGEQATGGYEQYELFCEPGDKLLLYSDGLTDQFGGSRNKKFGKRRLKELLSENHTLSATALKERILQTFNDWKGDFDQTDDTCFLVIDF